MITTWSPWPLSHSKVGKFRRCRLAFWRQYVERRPEARGTPGNVGVGFHDWAMEAKAGSDEIDLVRILARKAVLLDEEAAKQLRQLVRRYIERGGPPPIPVDAEDLMLETALALTLEGEPVAWDSPAARFRCRVDQAWTEHVDLGVLRDWKTSRIIEPVDATDQMRWYAFALASSIPSVERVHAELHYVRFAPGGVRKTDDPYDAEELRATVPEELRIIADKMVQCAEQERWDPTLGEHCRYCSYRAICPAFQATPLPVGEILTAEDASAAADRMLVLKVMLADYTSALRSYALHCGGIRVEDGLLAFHEKTKREIVDPELAVAFFTGAGVAHDRLWGSLKLSVTETDKIIREMHARAARGTKTEKIESTLAELKEMGVLREYTSTEFKRKKAGTEEEPEDAIVEGSEDE